MDKKDLRYFIVMVSVLCMKPVFGMKHLFASKSVRSRRFSQGATLFGDIDAPIRQKKIPRCVVCQRLFEQNDCIIKTNCCYHEFHRSCIAEYVDRSCPVCSVKITAHGWQSESLEQDENEYKKIRLDKWYVQYIVNRDYISVFDEREGCKDYYYHVDHNVKKAVDSIIVSKHNRLYVVYTNNHIDIFNLIEKKRIEKIRPKPKHATIVKFFCSAMIAYFMYENRNIDLFIFDESIRYVCLRAESEDIKRVGCISDKVFVLYRNAEIDFFDIRNGRKIVKINMLQQEFVEMGILLDKIFYLVYQEKMELWNIDKKRGARHMFVPLRESEVSEVDIDYEGNLCITYRDENCPVDTHVLEAIL